MAIKIIQIIGPSDELYILHLLKMSRLSKNSCKHVFTHNFTPLLTHSLRALQSVYEKIVPVKIRAVYMQVYLIRLLVLPQLLITVLWRNDNSSLGLQIMETRASGMNGRFPFTTAAPQQTAVAYMANAFSFTLSHNKIKEYRWCENKLGCHHSFLFYIPCAILCNPVFSWFQQNDTVYRSDFVIRLILWSLRFQGNIGFFLHYR